MTHDYNLNLQYTVYPECWLPLPPCSVAVQALRSSEALAISHGLPVYEAGPVAAEGLTCILSLSRLHDGDRISETTSSKSRFLSLAKE